MKKHYFIISFFVLIHSLPVFSQVDSFDPTLWLHNPAPSIKEVKSSEILNFKNQISSGISSRKLNSSGHLFVVYKSQKNENLLSR